MIPNHAQLVRIMSGQDTSPSASCWRLGLAALRPGYWAGLQADRAWCRARRRPLGRPTVSVGNLTTGGTGKTPMTIEVVRRLIAQGHRPAVLLRGYGSAGPEARQHADEAEVLHQALGPHVPVEPNPSRVQGAQSVLHKHPETTCFVLDDGFQHRRARRDLDLVLIDATRPFGFGRLLPRGLLREPLSALKRADAVILTRTDQVDEATLEHVSKKTAVFHGSAPLAHAAHRWTALHQMPSGEINSDQLEENTVHPLETLKNLDVFGVCGIGNPKNFEQQLAQHARKLLGLNVFDDHHPYTAGDLNAIQTAAAERGADAIVTTEKDWVKWHRLPNVGPLSLPVYRPAVAMNVSRGSKPLDVLLRERLPLPALPSVAAG